MRYKTNTKIIIDKRKLETLKRLNCPKEILIDLIFDGVLNLTGDSLIDDNLESLIEEKEFKNWGGNHNPKGNNQYTLGQVDQVVDLGQNIGQVGDKDKDKDKDKDLYLNNKRVVELDSKILSLNEKEKENKKEKESSAVEVWYGEYSNVHLKPIQYASLVQYVGKKEIADGLIEDLSANIAQKKENAPPYDDNFPDMHLVKLKSYWKYRKLGGNKSPDKEDKAAKFKNELEELTRQYRIKECGSG